MAVLQFIPIPAQAQASTITGLASGASTVEQAAGNNNIFVINSNQDICIRFGPPGIVSAATATDFRIPAGVPMTWDVGNQWSSFRCYNLGQSNANVYIRYISKF
jgi:hypothetical protein